MFDDVFGRHELGLVLCIVLLGVLILFVKFIWIMGPLWILHGVVHGRWVVRTVITLTLAYAAYFSS